MAGGGWQEGSRIFTVPRLVHKGLGLGRTQDSYPGFREGPTKPFPCIIKMNVCVRAHTYAVLLGMESRTQPLNYIPSSKRNIFK